MLFNKNENKPASSIEEKIKLYRRQGHIVPPRKIIKNAEQIEGIRESAKINTCLARFSQDVLRHCLKMTDN